MEELIFGAAAEQPLGRFVEPFGDVVYHSRGAIPRRASEFVLQKSSRSAADENRTREKA